MSGRYKVSGNATTADVFAGPHRGWVGLADRPRPFCIPSEQYRRIPTDSQRQKAYDAEGVLKQYDNQRRFITLLDVAHYYGGIIESAWFKKRWPAFKHLELKVMENWRLCRADAKPLQERYFRTHGTPDYPGIAHSDTESGRIRFGPGALECGEWLALHELAHCLCVWGHKHHPLWAVTYLELVRLKMGKEAHWLLRDSFRRHNVRYKARRRISDEQREALAQRWLDATARG